MSLLPAPVICPPDRACRGSGSVSSVLPAVHSPFFHEEKRNIFVPFLTSRQATPTGRKKPQACLYILSVLSWVCSEKEACPLGSCARAVLHKRERHTCGIMGSLNDVEHLLSCSNDVILPQFPLAIWLSYCKCA